MNATHIPYADTLEKATTLVEGAKQGGITIHRDGAVFNATLGYVIGGKVPTLKLDAEACGAAGKACNVIIARFIERTPTNCEYFGAWIDDGVLYVDACEYVEGYIDAFVLATERGEIAFFSFLTGKSEYVKG